MKMNEITCRPTIITYDISDDDIRNKIRDDIIIDKYGGAEITKSTYIVMSDESLSDIYDQIEPYLDNKDRLAVFTPKTSRDSYKMSDSCISVKVQKLMGGVKGWRILLLSGSL